jgi:uncharacterized protein (TIGR00297 family)
MDKEMHHQAVWRKAIPQIRDRIQSQLLVWVVGSLLVTLTARTLLSAYLPTSHFPVFPSEALAISLAFAIVVLTLRAATPAGAACGGMICLLLTYWTGSPPWSILRTALTPLTALFLLTFLSTRAGRQQKSKAGLAEARGGRTASQVIANLSVAAVCVTPAAIALGPLPVNIMILAALAEATADTVSSETGQAFGGIPVMFPKFHRVEPGTDGAVTPLGTMAGITAAFLVATAGAWAMHLHKNDVIITTAAATCGLFFDTLLGATLERKGWLGNDLVNFFSTAFAAILAAAAYRLYAL